MSQELAHCALECAVKAVDETQRTVEVVMSTPTIDRHDERVEQDWDLRSFAKNPVVLWAHDGRSPPIGRAENVRIEKGSLVGTIRFCSEKANPMAEQCLQLFREGVLNAVSVGFIPHSYRFEKTEDQEVLVLSQNELVELSVTPTPANPEALVRRRAKALATKSRGEDAGHAPTAPAVAPETLTKGQSPKKEENIMSENEKALQDKAEKQAVTIATMEAATKAADETIASLRAAAQESAATLKSLETDKAALEAQAKTLTADRDAEKARAEKAEGVIIELEVDSLVGKKITPAEKPLFVDLRKSNPDLFKKMVEQRQDMKLLESITEAGNAKNGAPSTSNADIQARIFGKKS